MLIPYPIRSSFLGKPDPTVIPRSCFPSHRFSDPPIAPLIALQAALSPNRDPSVVEALIGSLGPASDGKILVDIGAGNGFFSLAAAARGHNVIAFEASGPSIAAFSSSIVYNGFEARVRVYNVTLGATPGRVCVRRAGAGGEVDEADVNVRRGYGDVRVHSVSVNNAGRGSAAVSVVGSGSHSVDDIGSRVVGGSSSRSSVVVDQGTSSSGSSSRGMDVGGSDGSRFVDEGGCEVSIPRETLSRMLAGVLAGKSVSGEKGTLSPMGHLHTHKSGEAQTALAEPLTGVLQMTSRGSTHVGSRILHSHAVGSGSSSSGNSSGSSAGSGSGGGSGPSSTRLHTLTQQFSSKVSSSGGEEDVSTRDGEANSGMENSSDLERSGSGGEDISSDGGESQSMASSSRGGDKDDRMASSSGSSSSSPMTSVGALRVSVNGWEGWVMSGAEAFLKEHSPGEIMGHGHLRRRLLELQMIVIGFGDL